ncbi:MAG: response regulator [bacterium]|nr:response regulator [bacterium]MCM1423693.1 response regulator [bacterium]
MGDLKKIVVIDDSKVQLRALSELMKGKYEVATAVSGKEGIDILKQDGADLVLLDYSMPGMDGKETLEILQSNEETKHIPVIFITGDNDKEDIVAVLKLHPQGYLLKPVKPERLFEAIEGVFAK